MLEFEEEETMIMSQLNEFKSFDEISEFLKSKGYDINDEEARKNLKQFIDNLIEKKVLILENV